MIEIGGKAEWVEVNFDPEVQVLEMLEKLGISPEMVKEVLISVIAGTGEVSVHVCYIKGMEAGVLKWENAVFTVGMKEGTE